MSEILRLVFPVVLTYLGIMAMGFVDLLLVGRIGATEIGAVGLGTSLFTWFLMFSIGMVSGMDHLVSHARGADEDEKSHRFLTQGILLSAGITIPFTLILLFLSLHLEWFGTHPDVLPSAKRYTFILAFSLLPASVFNALRTYLTAQGRPKLGMQMLFFGNLVNAGLGYCLVLGNAGFSRLGAEGAGWATLISRIFMMAGLAWGVYQFEKKKLRIIPGTASAFKISDFYSHSKYLRPLIRLGTPAAFQMVFEVGVFALATGLAARFSPSDLAAHQIVLNIAGTTFMVPLGVGSAGAVLVGQALGRKQGEQACEVGRRCFQLGAGFMLVSALCLIAFSDPILRVFTQDPAVISIGRKILIVAALFQLSDGLQTVGTGLLRGLGETHSAMIFNLLGHWMVGLPLGIFLCFVQGWDVVGLWAGLSVGLTVVAISVSVRWIIRSGSFALTRA